MNDEVDNQEQPEETEEQKREKLKALIEEGENELLDFLYRKEAYSELEKLKEKQGKPPAISKMRRSKMTRDEKREVIKLFGIDEYNRIPL